MREYVEVGSRHPRKDLVQWLPTAVTEEDFVALKFDVDVGPSAGAAQTLCPASLVARVA